MTMKRRQGETYTVTDEAATIELHQEFNLYGFFLEELPHSANGPTKFEIATVDKLANQVFTAPSTAGEWRIWYSNAGRAAFVECHSTDNGKAVVISYTAQGSNPLAELYDRGVMLPNLKAKPTLATGAIPYWDGAAWQFYTLTQLLDVVIGTTDGKIIKRVSGTWQEADDNV